MLNHVHERFRKLSSVKMIIITTVSLVTRSPLNILQSAVRLNIFVVVIIIVVEQ